MGRAGPGPQLGWAVPDIGRAKNCVLWAGLLGTAQMYTYRLGSGVRSAIASWHVAEPRTARARWQAQAPHPPHEAHMHARRAPARCMQGPGGWRGRALPMLACLPPCALHALSSFRHRATHAAFAHVRRRLGVVAAIKDARQPAQIDIWSGRRHVIIRFRTHACAGIKGCLNTLELIVSG
jgi:hypothetical protein